MIWSSKATIETASEKYEFRKRIIKNNLPRINFDGKYDGSNKEYLVDLFQKNYAVIPSIDKLEDVKLLGNPNQFASLNGDYVDERTRIKFITDYKNMVYEYGKELKI